MELPKRKRLRLQEYDYSSPGAYFITICTHQRKCILSRVVGAIHESPETELTDSGKIVDGVIQGIPQKYGATVERYVIMPNHIHLLVSIIDGEDLRAIRESPLRVRSVVSNLVGYIKMNASKKIRSVFGDKDIWQRGFHDHIVRGKKDYEEIDKYICENPTRWQYDCFYTEE